MLNSSSDEEEIPIISPEEIQYEQINPDDLNVSNVFEQIIRSMDNMKNDTGKKVIAIFELNRAKIEEFIQQMFFYVHLSLYQSTEVKHIQNKLHDLSKQWTQFHYELEFEQKLEQKVYDRLSHCFPYFFTQAIQTIYVNITRGNPITLEKKI